MSDIQMTQLLAEMQRLGATAAGGTAAAPVGETPDGQAFSALLKASIDGVNEAQASAAQMAAAFERGDASVTLPEVMLALQKASLSFQAMTEVRNQLASAYQEIMNMPV